ncbi:IclR family transcriptional regulator domain-containing protein [Sphingobium chlorophenolicum]|uniref:Transcriptional regulator, IclR family n=1 Tax=Sphingobium chlorophenolicum TaxID=46429 RepID=A0A081RBZ2_SPHCR|nr:IclR family transcriptional regulator C-terminal domain-containing protein [Sphingobium chlorophenolicum]KEQ52715.1 Transcriptional regulator, IclR family [Sphingobium chlorophenolicum]
MREETGAEFQGDPEFMMSLARGLAVLRCFAERERPMTIAQAAEMTGLSRAAVRRCLYTLTRLGYAAQEDLSYVLRPKVLSLGYAYLSSSSLAARAQPILDQLRDELGESCSLGVLEEDEVYYVARAEAGRIMSIALLAGSRLPLYATSMGRVLLAAQSREAQEAYLARTELVALTAKTERSKPALLAKLEQVREEGFAIIDQELEPGLRSIAVPVQGRNGVIAALNVGTQAARITTADLRTRCLSALRRGAQRLSMIAAM